MKPIELKLNSWHAWILDKCTPWYVLNNSKIDLCQYIRRVAFGLVVFTLSVGTLGGAILALLANVVYWDIGMITGYIHWIDPIVDKVTGKITNDNFAMTRQMIAVITQLIFVAIGLVAGLIFSLIGIKNAAEDYFCKRDYLRKTGRLPARKPPGFLTLAYRSIKDKVCYQVNFK